jgi:hypothetical protein
MNRKLTVVGMAVLALGMASAVAKEKKPSKGRLPPKVMAAVKSTCPSGEIQAVERAKEDGRVEYEVELLVDGKSCDLKVAANGTVLEVERQVALDKLPAAVRSTLALFTKAEVEKAEQVTKGTDSFYEVVIELDDSMFELKITADGKISEIESMGGEGRHDADEDDDKDNDGEDEDEEK